jgi:thioredoxin 1
MNPRILCFALLAALALLNGCSPAHRSSLRHEADGTVVETTDSSFVVDVIQPRRPAVVYYWAHTCIPCYLLGPRIRKLAPRYSGRVTFWKLDMGWSAARVQRYGIGGWPALAFYVGDRRLRVIAGPEGHVDDSLAAFVDEGLRLAALPDSAVPGARPALR